MMQPQELAARLRGVIGFPITSFHDDYSINMDGFRQNVEFMVKGGLHALVAAGGTGELFGLNISEIKQVIKNTVEVVAGRIPVIAGVGFNAAIGRELAQYAQEVGADGILILPPYYAHPDPNALVEYYRQIAESTDLGVMPYSRDGALLTPDITAALAEQIPNMIAFKDGQADIRMFQRNRARVGKRFVWLAGVGDDLVIPYFASGAEGYTSSLAVFWPEGSLELLRLAQAGDFKALQQFHHEKVQPIYDLRYRRRGYEVSVMKEAMNMLGMPAGPVRPPLANMSEYDLAHLRNVLVQIGLLSEEPQRSTPVA